MKLRFAIFLFAITISDIHADESIQAKLIYETNISGPSIIELCNNVLWVYSVGEKELWSLNPLTGTALTKTPLSKLKITGTLTALGCKKNLLLAASYHKDTKHVFFHTFSDSFESVFG